jgi:hypothetical protein
VTNAEQVIEGVELVGGAVNTDHETLLAHIASSIRRGHPQIKPQGYQEATVALVCGGPSLNGTVDELRDAIAAGAKVVTVNGAYGWCLERNIVPSMQIVMDARATNARFLDPPLPRCHYALASQCHPDLWDALDGRPHVWIYHIGVNDENGPAKDLLDAYYLKQWHGIGGGTTVGTRAIALLRTLGYVRFEVFGMDSCWMGDANHAYPQQENATDQCHTLTAHPTGHPELARVFRCSPWHVQQIQDFLQMVRFSGQHFLLNLHGDGILSYILQSTADLVVNDEPMT